MIKKNREIINGILLLDKPVGLSSNRALQFVKSLINAKKAGHTGTLDPFSEGLLVCCIGNATKLANIILRSDKAYKAIMRFGKETDSGDLTGKVVQEASHSFSGVNSTDLQKVLNDFLDSYKEQVPPMYSAIKRNGKPLYQYARKGVELDRPKRNITLYQLDLLCCNELQAEVNIVCSKGTYIRVLAQDIGRKLGCFAYLTELKRTRVGPFSLDYSVKLEHLKSVLDPLEYLIHLDRLPDNLISVF